MSFAEEYLNLTTKCSETLKKFKNKTFIIFGRKVKVDSYYVADIVRSGVEDYADPIIVKLQYEDNFKTTYEEVEITDTCLFNEDLIKADIPLEDEIVVDESVKLYLNYSDIHLSNEQLIEAFSLLNKENLNYFCSLYYTALHSKIVSIYRDQYKNLKLKYKDLPYYPPFQFFAENEEYYESSTC